MNIFNLIESVDKNKLNLEEHLANTSRRDVFRHLGDFGKKLALGAVSFGAVTAAGSQKAMAADGSITDVLNFALLLEYLESEFYLKGLDSKVIPVEGFQQQIFMQISKHESQHVEFLKSAISSLGGTPIEKPKFDFTVGGAFDPFGSYGDFLVLSQAFEDTGVRAYKGQAGNLIGNGAVLTAALQIHSVEARHAARVRRLRAQQGWITLDKLGNMPAATRAVYKGEEQTTQGGVDVTMLTTFGAEAVSESFDEPLSKEEVTAIASLFLV